MDWVAGWLGRAREFEWERGVRAGVAVGSAMVVTHELGRPFGWAAFGAFMAILVDTGGSYRIRLKTMVTALGGGAIAAMFGSLIGSGTLLPAWIGAIMAATAVVCFVLTFARVVAQPIASTSVMILVTYFAGLGGSQHTFAAAREGAAMLLAGGLWATGLSLIFWPLDPFRPARLAVAKCYALLAEFTLQLGRNRSEDSTAEDLVTYESRRGKTRHRRGSGSSESGLSRRVRRLSQRRRVPRRGRCERGI